KKTKEMKKKLMFLALGVVAACSVAFSQVNVNETINGNNIVGTVTNVNSGQTLNVGTQITFVSAGVQYTYQVTTVPSTNPAGILSFIANAINNAFNTASVRGALAGGLLPNVFGSNAGEFSVTFLRQENVPFDLGLSAVLGAGAIAAVKARRRKKELEIVA
ncbi:MAG: hypothetical protein JWR72_1911, partial [Flavisolibacter sp.]|nr:hypothetical protein [Flavisolibacter sp.]